MYQLDNRPTDYTEDNFLNLFFYFFNVFFYHIKAAVLHTVCLNFLSERQVWVAFVS